VIKLDVGCGGKGSRQVGFIGIDIWPRPADKTEDEYFQLDFIKDNLPWNPETIDEIIAIHIIEHMVRDEGKVLIQRAYDLLKAGATLTITCPDLELLVVKYLEKDFDFYEKKYKNGRLIWQGPTLADRLNWAIHQQGHKWSYDNVSLLCLAREALGTSDGIEPINANSRFYNLRDHETGIVITK